MARTPKSVRFDLNTDLQPYIDTVQAEVKRLAAIMRPQTGPRPICHQEIPAEGTE